MTMAIKLERSFLKVYFAQLNESWSLIQEFMVLFYLKKIVHILHMYRKSIDQLAKRGLGHLIN